jgi:hypothetical protein
MSKKFYRFDIIYLGNKIKITIDWEKNILKVYKNGKLIKELKK